MATKTVGEPQWWYDMVNKKTNGEFIPDNVELLNIISIQSKRLDDAHARLDKAFNKISQLEEADKNIHTKFHHIYSVINLLMCKIHKFGKIHHYTRNIASFCRNLINPIPVFEKNAKRAQIERNSQIKREQKQYERSLRIQKIQEQKARQPFVQSERRNKRKTV